MKLLKSFLILNTLLISLTISGQLVQPSPIMSKYDNGSLKIRWEPQSIEEWNVAMKSGYDVSIFQGSLLIEKRSVRISTYEDLIKLNQRTSPFLAQFYEGAAKLLYPQKSSSPDDQIGSYFEGESSEGLDSLRLGLIIYSSLYDFNLTKAVGLGAEFSVSQGKNYRIIISVAGGSSREYNTFTKLENEEMTQLKAEWGDEEVKVEWNTAESKGRYYGYYIEESKDGFHYILSDSIPWVNTNDRFAVADDVFKKMGRTIKLERNYETTYLRLRGLDYFGEMSTSYSLAVGHGYEKLTLSPFIIFADQTEENEAHIKWMVAEQENYLIKKFSLLRADTISGPYEIVLDSIGSGTREIKIPMKNTQNHYRIEAFAKEGEGLSSNPVFVMGQDTIPPAVPTVIGAVLDTLDRVQITWYANQETDLWGYRIFKANFGSDEFTLMNAYPTLDTVWIDTVDTKLGNKNVYYFLEAADKRNNRSGLTDTIRVALPDLIPPLPPMVSKVEQRDTVVRVYYAKSGSEDAMGHNIYRKVTTEDKGWQRIRILSNENLSEYFEDDDVKIGVQYAYTITATDAAGNESKPEYFQQVKLVKKEEPYIAFKKVDYSLNKEEKSVTLSWEYDDNHEILALQLYRGVSLQMMSDYATIDINTNEYKELCSAYEGQVLYYKLKPIYKDQPIPLMSNPIAVMCDFSDNEKGKE